MKKIITTLLIITLANIACIGYVLAESGKGTVNASELNFRESANTSANAIDVLYKGARVNIIAEEGDWYKVKYNNEEGYVSKQYITRESSGTNLTTQNNTNTSTQNNTSSANNTSTNSVENSVQTNETTSNNPTTIDVNELNKTKIKQNTTLYVLPLINSTKLTNINAQAQVLLISVNGDWSYIQTENNNGWVLTKTLEKTSITLPNGETNSNNTINNNENTISNNTVNENNTTSANTVENTTANNTTNVTSNETTTTPTPTVTSTPTPTPSNNNYPTTMYVNVEAVNVRSSANTSSTIVTSVGKGQGVTVESKQGDWYKVKTSDGNGYIKGEYLSKNR